MRRHRWGHYYARDSLCKNDGCDDIGRDDPVAVVQKRKFDAYGDISFNFALSRAKLVTHSYKVSSVGYKNTV